MTFDHQDKFSTPAAAGAGAGPTPATAPATAAGVSASGLTAAIIGKLTWKSDLMDAYTTALLRAALGLRAAGTNYFNNDDVPASAQPNDKTTVGTVFGLLLKEGVIKKYLGSIASKKIWGGMRSSSREKCNSHRNQLYAVAVPLAREWLRRHGRELPAGPQMDLFAQPVAAAKPSVVSGPLPVG